MHALHLTGDGERIKTVLCLGAHCDDIEIGCGGSILQLSEQYRDISFCWVVFSADDERGREAKKSAELFLARAGNKKIIIKTFRNGFFPYIGAEIKEYFEELKHIVSPDLIFTHYRHDRHQDHRLIAELTWNTFRNHFILEYEVLKYDGDLGIPNIFIPLNGKAAERKLDHLLECFESQKTRPWFTRDAFASLLRIRGVECHAPSGLAEAFHGNKMQLSLTGVASAMASSELATDGV